MSCLQPLSTAELAQRAQGLRRLGNSPAAIRAVLADLEATPEQIVEVMAGIEKAQSRRQKSDSRFVALLGGAVAILFVAIFFATYWRFVGASPLSVFLPATTAPAGQAHPKATATLSVKSIAQTLAPGIPVEMLPSLLPSNLPANFMLSTPVVVREATTGAGTRCPRSSVDAARLFGGDPSSWTYDPQTNGWTLTVVGPGVTLHIPEGMRGGYLLLVNGPEMRSVDGPATIKGINFIAVSCD